MTWRVWGEVSKLCRILLTTSCTTGHPCSTLITCSMLHTWYLIPKKYHFTYLCYVVDSLNTFYILQFKIFFYFIDSLNISYFHRFLIIHTTILKCLFFCFKPEINVKHRNDINVIIYNRILWIKLLFYLVDHISFYKNLNVIKI